MKRRIYLKTNRRIMFSHKFKTILLFSVLVFSFCDKSQERGEILSPNLTTSAPARFNGLEFSVPKSIPDSINNLAAARAVKLYCDGVRILATKSENGTEKFHILWFTDNSDNIVDEAFVNLDGSVEEINKIDFGYVNSIWRAKDNKLHKVAHGVHYCNDLATFFTGTSGSGNSFTVTQAAHEETGYFHKLLYCLGTSSCLIQCDGTTYPGGFNDLLSSHDWPDLVDLRFPQGLPTKQITPNLMRVYRDTNLSTLLWTFTGSSLLIDNDWTDNYCNDSVSSLRIEYWIENL